MTSPTARLAKLEAHYGDDAPADPGPAETAKYGENLWTSDSHRCYYRFADGLHHLTILHSDGTEAVVYTTEFDPRGGGDADGR